MKYIHQTLICVCLILLVFTGCGSGYSEASNSESSAETEISESEPMLSAQEEKAPADITDDPLVICCSASYKNAANEIIAAFEEETGVKAKVIYGDDNQLTGYIQNCSSCDLFIPGSISGYSTLSTSKLITGRIPLLKRMPVIAVPSGNPSGVRKITDFSHTCICYGFCDPRTSMTGKVTRKILTDIGIRMDTANITICQNEKLLAEALSQKKFNGAIMWDADAYSADGVDVVLFANSGNYTVEIPVLTLSKSVNTDSREAFLDYLQREDVKNMWLMHHLTPA